MLRFSALPLDWFVTPEEPERKLFPGFIAYASAIAALFAARRHKPQFLLALLWIVIGFAGSLGLNFVFHQFLFGGVPGFRAVRSPARWAVLAYIGLAILIAVVTAVLARRNRWVALAIPVALVIELSVAPVRWFMVIPEAPDVYRWLAKQPPSPIVELPLGSSGPEYLYMFRATVHGQRTVNGISGFAPPRSLELTRLANEAPISDAFVDALREEGVKRIVVHADMLGDRRPVTTEWISREIGRGRMRFAGNFDTPLEGDWVFSLEGGRPGAIWTPPPNCGDSIFGALDFPPGGTRFEDGRALFSGWTMSRHGIRHVDLLFDNHRERLRAELVPDARLQERCPGQPFTRTRFLAVYEKRPPGIDLHTDVQVEVTDGRGHTAVFEDRWITWE